MTTLTERPPTLIYAPALRGLYSYVHNISITFSMVSTPRQTLLTTLVGGTQPLTTFSPIRLLYRYNKRHRKLTSSPITTCSRPIYLLPLPLPPTRMLLQTLRQLHLSQHRPPALLDPHLITRRHAPVLQMEKNKVSTRKCNANGLKESA